MGVEFWQMRTYLDTARREFRERVTSKKHAAQDVLSKLSGWQAFYTREHAIECARNGFDECKAVDSKFSKEDMYQILDSTLSHLSAEHLLYSTGRQYFKVYPDFVHCLRDSSLELQGEYFRTPYSAFEVCLPKEGGGFMYGGHELRGFLVFDGRAAIAKNSEWVEAICESSGLGVSEAKSYAGVVSLEKLNLFVRIADVVAKEANSKYREQLGGQEITGDDVQILCVYADSTEDSLDSMRTFYMFMPIVRGITLEQSISLLFAKVATADAETQERLVRQLEIFRFIVSLCFLITGKDRIVEPDVLTKDLQKFVEAKDEAQIEVLHDRATRRRGVGRGYTVGRRERLLHLAKTRTAEVEAETGQTLKFQHQRRGHLHRYLTKKGYVIKFIPQLTVRPDLPVEQVETGRGLKVK